jgi:hypothetical protein
MQRVNGDLARMVNSKCSLHERSDIRENSVVRLGPHIAPLTRATCYFVARYWSRIETFLSRQRRLPEKQRAIVRCI